MKKITAQVFYQHWLSFSKLELELENKWKDAWNTSKDWSKLILGTKTSSNSDSPIGNYFKEKYKKELRYRTEDGLYDLSFSLGGNIKTIPSLNSKYETDKFELGSEIYYPSVYDVLLEHENEIYDSWQEVAKLAYVRAYLKVLVTYHTDNLAEYQIANERKMMIDTFNTIVKQCSKEFSDNSQTEYLLILGRNKSGVLSWDYQIFNFEGTSI